MRGYNAHRPLQDEQMHLATYTIIDRLQYASPKYHHTLSSQSSHDCYIENISKNSKNQIDFNTQYYPSLPYPRRISESHTRNTISILSLSGRSA